MPEVADTQRQRLYHFTSTKFALDDIRNSHLKIAQISDLNDPFELRCMDTSGRNKRRAYDSFKEDFATRWGVVCFSENWNDILQWAHYADRHRGICLGFEVTGEPAKFAPVRYVGKKDPALEPDRAYAWRCLTTKFECWSYEREWRVFTTLKDGEWNEAAGRKLYFAEFGKELALREVLLGATNTTSAREIFDLVATDVRVARVQLADATFALTLSDRVRP